MKIYYASKSLPKENSIKKIYPDAIYVNVIDRSFVSEQPIGFHETNIGVDTRQNALIKHVKENYANEILNQPSLFISIESGIMYEDSVWRDNTIIRYDYMKYNENIKDYIIISKKSLLYGPQVPRKYINVIFKTNKKITLGKFLSEIYSNENIHHQDWYIHKFDDFEIEEKVIYIENISREKMIENDLRINVFDDHNE